MSKERKGRRFFLSFACVKSKYNGEIRDEKERTESWKKYSNLSEILFCLRYGFIFRKAIGRNTYPPHPLVLERCMYPRETTDDPPTSRHVLYIFYIYIYQLFNSLFGASNNTLNVVGAARAGLVLCEKGARAS